VSTLDTVLCQRRQDQVGASAYVSPLTALVREEYNATFHAKQLPSSHRVMLYRHHTRGQGCQFETSNKNKAGAKSCRAGTKFRGTANLLRFPVAANTFSFQLPSNSENCYPSRQSEGRRGKVLTQRFASRRTPMNKVDRRSALAIGLAAASAFMVKPAHRKPRTSSARTQRRGQAVVVRVI